MTHPNLEVLFVCYSQAHAQELKYSMNLEARIGARFVGAGAALAGSRFDLILVPAGWDEYWSTRGTEKQLANDWLNQIRCRLYPGGRMLTVEERDGTVQPPRR